MTVCRLGRYGVMMIRCDDAVSVSIWCVCVCVFVCVWVGGEWVWKVVCVVCGVTMVSH
jgi:hypothetical protein